MKFAICMLCFVSAFGMLIAADAGYFIPRAFYTLDAEGHKSNIHPISPHTTQYLRRLRRQTISSSSSSSSSVASDGGPVLFTTKQVVQHIPEIDIASRFGGTPSATGHVIQTTGVVDQQGRVTYKTQQGHF